MRPYLVQPHAEPYRANPGARTGIVLCHGFTGSPASLRPWARGLAEAGLRVELPRLPGHGTDWHEMAITSWEDWYACVDRSYRMLEVECDRVFVAGLSMGGSLALRLAERHEPAGLVLVNPSVGAADPRLRFLPLLRRLLRSIPGLGNDIALAGADEGAYARTPVASVWSMSQLWADVTAGLDRVECDVLLFTSRVDHVVDETSRVLLRQRLRHLEEVELQNSYHVATLDHDAGLIEERTLGFIEQHGGLPSRATETADGGPVEGAPR